MTMCPSAQHAREVWVLPRGQSPILTGQFDHIGPALADDTELGLTADDVLLLQQNSISGIAG